MKPEIFVLNENTLIPFLLRALMRGKPYFLGVNPAFPPASGLLNRLAQWALSANLARPASDLYPNLKALNTNPILTSLYDVFATIEPWQDHHYRFNKANQDPDYGMAFKQVTCKYLQDRYIQAIATEGILENQGGENAVNFYGLNADAQGLLKAWTGTSDANAMPRAGSIGGAILNAMLEIAVTLYLFFWIAFRTRLRITPVPVSLAADYLEDPRDNQLYMKARQAGPVLIIKRMQGMTFETAPSGDGYLTSTWNDGRFGLFQALQTGAMVVKDAFQIFKRYHWTAPQHYYALASLPYKRIIVRSLLNRYRPRYFWGRDEYNVEHIIRHQELRRIKAKSLGLMHGVQALSDLIPRRRYISFDIFYMFGPHLYNKHHRSTWAADMVVRAIGSFGFSREQFQSPRPKNPQTIAIFVAFCVNQPEFTKVVRQVAAAFPQYQVFIKPKKVSNTPNETLMAKLCDGLDNVALATTSAADLIYSARYVLSEASTIVTEAIHLGVPTLMLDMLPDHRQCLYRDFPGLCVSTAKETVSRLKDWEEGRKIFDRTVYEDLIDLSGQWAFDIVGEDMGLDTQADVRTQTAPC